MLWNFKRLPLSELVLIAKLQQWDKYLGEYYKFLLFSVKFQWQSHLKSLLCGSDDHLFSAQEDSRFLTNFFACRWKMKEKILDQYSRNKQLKVCL